MPVYKYRDVSEMPDDTWKEPGDPALFRAIRATWELARRTIHARFPPGVYKHPSAAAADALRSTWDRSNFEAFRAGQARARSGTRDESQEPGGSR